MLTLDQIFSPSAPFEYDQGDVVTTHYDDLYNLKLRADQLPRAEERVAEQQAKIEQAHRDIDVMIQQVDESREETKQAEQQVAALTEDRDNARRTAQYWKDEHLAANKVVAALTEALRGYLRQHQGCRVPYNKADQCPCAWCEDARRALLSSLGKERP